MADIAFTMRGDYVAGRTVTPEGTAAFAAVLFTALFLAFPAIDLWASGLFWSADGFVLAGHPVLKALRKSSSWVLAAILLYALWEAVRDGLRRDWATAAMGRCGFLLAGLALGPGLLVNALLKDNWGRPRPVSVDLFGGEAPYVPVWAISDWCDRNCSFVSGESASAAWMVAAALVLAPGRLRTPVVAAACAYGAALSLNRLAFGGHFLSDILLSWSLTALTLALLARVMRAPVDARARRRVRRWRLKLARLGRPSPVAA